MLNRCYPAVSSSLDFHDSTPPPSLSKSIFQKIAKRVSLPRQAISRSRSLLHCSSTESVICKSNDVTSVDNQCHQSRRSSSTAVRSSWHGVFSFGCNGSQGHVSKLLMLTSHHQWPKIRSLNVLRRGSDDSGYSSQRSRASQVNCSPTQTQDEKIESLLSPASTLEDVFRTGSSPTSAYYQTPSRPFFRHNLIEEPTAGCRDVYHHDTIDEDIHMLIPEVDAVDSCPELDTESCCSFMTCTVDDVLESDWPELGFQYATDAAFLERKEEIANMLKAPLWWNYGVEHTLEERAHKLKTPAWWTCRVAQPQKEQVNWVSTYRRSLHS